MSIPERKTLGTVGEVIDALGGGTDVARLVGRSPQAVTNWRARGFCPPETFVVLTAALDGLGLEASPELWRMLPAEPVGARQ